MVGKKHSGKADQLTFASEGSEHAYLCTCSIAISSGKKMNFSLYANILDFCSDSNKLRDVSYSTYM